jgi:multidrug resistance efflux pump
MTVQALENQQTVDTTSTSQPRPAEVTAQMVQTGRVVIVALILSGIATGFLTQDNSERFAGYLKTEKQTVVAPVNGIVEFVDVATGQAVLPGHELFTIRDTQLATTIADAEREVKRINSLLETAKTNAQMTFEQRLVEIDQDIFQTKLQLAGFLEAEYQHKFEVTAIEEYVDLFDALASSNVATFDLKSIVNEPKQADRNNEMFSIIKRATLTNQIETLQAKISLCENHLSELNDGKDKFKKQVASMYKIEELEAQAKSAQAKLEEVSNQEYSQSIVASVYGMAGVSHIKLDSEVKAGQVLTELFDRDREFIQVQLPSRVFPTLSPGSIVRVHFPGDIEREGKIKSIPPQVTVDGTHGHPESQIDLQVFASGKPWPAIPIGSTVYISLLEDCDSE